MMHVIQWESSAFSHDKDSQTVLNAVLFKETIMQMLLH